MGISISGYTFEGPFKAPANLENRSGVYAILDYRSDGKYYVTDVGESANVRDRVEHHDRAACWKRHTQGALYYAAHYTDNAQQSGRKVVEQKIRNQYKPPCGDR